MALSEYEKIAFKLFGPLVRRYEDDSDLSMTLLKAHRLVRPEVFMATVFMNAAMAAGFGLLLGALLKFLVPGLLMTALPKDSPMYAVASFLKGPLGFAVMAILPVVLGVIFYFIGVSDPGSKIKARGKDIDHNLAYAANYMAAMASADVNPDVIFRGLAKQSIYGEIQKEAAWVARDMDALGKDLLTALHDGVDRSPSIKLQDFFQGIITTTLSGGDLKTFFSSKAEQYTKENRIEQKGAMESLGLYAETFVTVVVAAPLLLIIIMSVMAMMGGSSTLMLKMIIFALLPLSQFIFAYLIKSLSLGG